MRSLALLAALVGSAIATSTASAADAAHPAANGYAKVLEACPAPTRGHATCFALVREPVAAPAPGEAPSAGAQPFVAGAGALTAGPAGGLTPADLASAYGYSPTATGSGQTVAIVDAFDDPAIESDLGEFDAHYGLAACTTANGCFKKVGQTGSPSSLPAADKEGWSVEIALDVETVHAACPNCKILLVESNDTSYANLATAVNEAVALGATVVSNSYGGAEAGPKAAERAAYNHAGIPIVASTGDDGYYGWDWVNEGFFGDEMPSFPASLATTVAVGGTTLQLNTDATRADETVWNNNGPGDQDGLASEEREGATGGGCSKIFTAQPWQHSVANFAASGCGEKRLDADVAAVADPLTGLDIYDTYKCGTACNFPRVEVGWVTVGGTSLSAPFISSLYALAGGGGVSDPSLTLYGHAADASLRFDVLVGGSGFCGGESLAKCISEFGGEPNELGAGVIDCEGTTACNAASGFDGPSGIGTPKGLGLFKPLLPTAAFTAPASPQAGKAASFNAGASSDPYPGGSIASYAWSWGDGTANGAGVSPSHTYAVAGTYQVSLTVTDNYGLASDPSAKSVEVLKITQAEEEAAARQKQEEEAAAKHKQEEEAAAARKHEEEAAARVQQEEAERAAAKRKLEEESVAARLREEERAAVIPTTNVLSTGLGGGLRTPVPDARLAGRALTASASGVIALKISCPGGESTCKGTVTLRTVAAVSARFASTARRKAIVTLASASFSVAGGKTASVTLRLSVKARSLLARVHTLPAAATIIAHDAAGATHTTKSAVTLRVAKAKRGAH